VQERSPLLPSVVLPEAVASAPFVVDPVEGLGRHWSDARVMLRWQIPKFLCLWLSGLSRSIPPCLRTFAGMDNAAGCSQVPVVQGVAGGGARGRDRTQSDSSPGKAGAPHSAPVSWDPPLPLQPWRGPSCGRLSGCLVTCLGIDED